MVDEIDSWIFKHDPSRVQAERYRTTAALFTEVPGSATDKARQEAWAADNRAQRHITTAQRRKAVEQEALDKITRTQQQFAEQTAAYRKRQQDKRAA